MVRRRERFVPPVPKMEEPVKKKPKVDGEEDEESEEGDNDLERLQQSLLGNCLCDVPEKILYKPFQSQTRTNETGSECSVSDLSQWEPDRILKFLTCIQCLCEVSIRQNSEGYMCTRVGDVCDALIKNEHGVVDQLVDLVMDNNQFICYAACRALSSFFIVCKGNVDVKWLERIAENALTTTVPRRMSTSLEVVKRVVEWKVKSPHPLEYQENVERTNAALHPTCNATSLMDTESPDFSEVSFFKMRQRLDTKQNLFLVQ